MIDARDVQALRLVRSELARRGIDTGRADVRLMHGVLTIRGTVGLAAGAQIPSDLKTEMDQIARFLRQRADIREVIIDCATWPRHWAHDNGPSPARQALAGVGSYQPRQSGWGL